MKYKIEELSDKIQSLEQKVSKLENHYLRLAHLETVEDWGGALTPMFIMNPCHRCGLEFKDSTGNLISVGYTCKLDDCPCFGKTVE